MIILSVVAIACIAFFFYFRSLLFKYMDRVGVMPLMKWMSFDEIRRRHFDDSEFWTQIMLLALLKQTVIEGRPLEGFEGVCV
ncbi:MAG TPA: hypothetical protein PLV25_08255, partial [Opitutales bacterium]|nr:hypothetical protein [Opitutales bacterium]